MVEKMVEMVERWTGEGQTLTTRGTGASVCAVIFKTGRKRTRELNEQPVLRKHGN